MLLLLSMAATANAPSIVASVAETAVGNYVLFTPAANGNYRATVYLEATIGVANLTCANVSWVDDNNNGQTAPASPVCTDRGGKGSFVVPIRAKSGTNIELNVTQVSAIGPSTVYATLEQL